MVEKKEDESADSLAKGSKALSCPKHAGENLKYLNVQNVPNWSALSVF